MEMGVRLYEGTPMRRLGRGDTPAVETPGASYHARKVVVAINAWMARQFPEFERTIAIVSSDMVITEPRPIFLRRSD